MKRKILTLFVALVILLAGCGAPSAGTEATPTPYPTPVKATFTVQRGDIAIDAKLTGRVSPLALNTVYFQINGQVSEVLAQKISALIGQMNLPQRLRDAGVSLKETDLPRLAQLAFQSRTVQNNPTPIISVNQIENLLKAAW